MRSRIFGVGAAGAALALTAALAGGSGAHAGSPAVHRAADDVVVSLGDSFISGEAGRWRGNGNTAYGSAYGTDLAAERCNPDETRCEAVPSRVYGDTYDPSGENGCNRSVHAEITHLDSVAVGGQVYTIPPANRLNFACSGATADAVSKPGFKNQRAQIDQLKDAVAGRSVRLVVLSVGGNDLGFGNIIRDCIKGFLAPSGFGWHCNVKQRALAKQNIEEVMKPAVREALTTITNNLDGSYRLVLQSYPSPIPAGPDNRYPPTYKGRYFTGGCPFFDDDSTWAHNELVPSIAEALREVADKHTESSGKQVEFLDLTDALKGHEACAVGAEQSRSGHTLANPLPDSKSEWVRYYPGLAGLQGQEQETLHPNATGQAKLGRCLREHASAEVTASQCPRSVNP